MDLLPPHVQTLLNNLVDKRTADMRKEIAELKERDAILNNRIRMQKKEIDELQMITQMYEKARIGRKTKSMEQKAVQVDIRGVPERAFHPVVDFVDSCPVPLMSDDEFRRKRKADAVIRMRERSLPVIKEEHPFRSTAVYVAQELAEGQGMDLDPGPSMTNSNGSMVEHFEHELEEGSNDSDILELEGAIDPELMAKIRSNLTSCKREK